MFFLKYKGGGRGVNLILPIPQKELPSESPALLGLSYLQQVAVRVEEQKSNSKNSRRNWWLDCLIGNKIANKIKAVAKDPKQNNSETITNEHDK